MARHCTCTGAPDVYCPWCTALAQRSGVVLPGRPRQAAAQAPHLPTGRTGGISGGIDEAIFQEKVLAIATDHGWLTYHPYDSRKSAGGFPDLVMVRDSIIFAELKTNTGKPTPEQERWLQMLAHAGQVDVYLWRPSDWLAIVERLTRPQDVVD